MNVIEEMKMKERKTSSIRTIYHLALQNITMDIFSPHVKRIHFLL